MFRRERVQGDWDLTQEEMLFYIHNEEVDYICDVTYPPKYLAPMLTEDLVSLADKTKDAIDSLNQKTFMFERKFEAIINELKRRKFKKN